MPRYITQRRQWHPTPVLLPGKSHGWKNLVGCSPWDSLRVGHDWASSLSLFTFMHWRRKWQPTPVFLPGESQGRRSLVGCLYGVTQSRTRLKWLSSSSWYITGIKNPPAKQCRRHKRHRFDAWIGKSSWRRKQQPLSEFLPGKFHGQCRLAGYSPWGRKESNMTEELSTHTLRYITSIIL